MPRLALLKLTLTERCNLSCRYCDQHRTRPRTMSPATLRAAIDLARDLGDGGATLLLSGGEPLLARDLVLTVLEHHPPRQIRLLTNGLLLDDALLARLDDGQTQLQISVDGTARAQADRGPGTWPVIARLLETIGHRFPQLWRRHLALATTITPWNVGQLADWVDRAMALDVGRLDLTLMRGPAPCWGRATCATLARQLRRVLATSRRYRRATGLVPVALLNEPVPIAPADGQPCAAADLTALSVAADGSVDACGTLAAVARRHPSDTLRVAAGRLRLGTVDDPDLPATWRRQAAAPTTVFSRRRQRQAGGRSCGHCAARGSCVICPAAGPEPNLVPDAHCLFRRWSIHARRVMEHDEPVYRRLVAAGSPEHSAWSMAGQVRRAMINPSVRTAAGPDRP